jgi:hypothetical protein
MKNKNFQEKPPEAHFSEEKPTAKKLIFKTLFFKNVKKS